MLITPQDHVCANLMPHLHRDWPLAPLRRVGTLAARALGILRSKSLHVGQILTARPVVGTRDTRKKRGPGVLKPPDGTVESSSEPLARRLWQRLAGGGARIHWTIDRTEGGALNIWGMSVAGGTDVLAPGMLRPCLWCCPASATAGLTSPAPKNPRSAASIWRWTGRPRPLTPGL